MDFEFCLPAGGDLGTTSSGHGGAFLTRQPTSMRHGDKFRDADDRRWRMIVLAIVALMLALLPALMTIKNLSVFRDPSKEEKGTQVQAEVGVSVLIPARNE